MQIKRWKPRKDVVDATHQASDEDYAKLAQAVLVAIIERKRDVVLRFPYFVEFDESFPKGIIVKKDSQHNYYKAKVWKLANWLFEKGHLPQDHKNIMKSMRELAYLEGRINKILDSPLEDSVECRLQIEEGSGDGH
jgi:hypothetical protein